MKIYIAGPMTGQPDLNYPAFDAAEIYLLRLKHAPFNPASIGRHFPNDTWEQHLRRDIAALCGCEAIVLLAGWQNSRGAKLEFRTAADLGLEIYMSLGAVGVLAEAEAEEEKRVAV